VVDLTGIRTQRALLCRVIQSSLLLRWSAFGSHGYELIIILRGIHWSQYKNYIFAVEEQENCVWGAYPKSRLNAVTAFRAQGAPPGRGSLGRILSDSISG